MLNKSLLITLLASAISSAAFAASPEATDRDLDNDGLIEINNWADLNEIRNNNSGKLYGSNLGCPTAGCTGYELTADLDFDTNGNGKFDANDAYWNNGDGWIPLNIGNTEIEGNGHLIRNLIVNNKVAFGGLFGSVKNLHIRNLGLTGKLMSIEAITYAGGFAGAMEGGSITGSFSTGRITTTGNYAGGLVGTSYGTAFKAVFSSALVDGAINGGGLIGYADAASTIYSSYAVGKTSAAQPYQGLANGGTVTNSYWASDAKGDDTRITNTAGGTDSRLWELAYATNNIDCSQPLIGPLFEGWDHVKDAKGNLYWDFGTTQQLPGLVLNGVLYRDSNGNGILDSDESVSSSSFSSNLSSTNSSRSTSSVAGNVAPIIKARVQIGSSSHEIYDATETIDPNGDTLTFTWNFGEGEGSSYFQNSALVERLYHYFTAKLVTPSVTVDDGHGGVSTMSWAVQRPDWSGWPASSSRASRSSSSSSSSVKSIPAACLSSTSSSSSEDSYYVPISSSSQGSYHVVSSSAAMSVAASEKRATNSGGGSMDLLMLVLLSGLGLAWRGKKAA